MKRAFDKITNGIIGVSVLAIIIGFVLIIYPGISLKTVGVMSAIYLIVHGVILILLDISLGKILIPFENMITAVLSLILGIVLFTHPENAIILLTISFGVWIIVTSINHIKMALFLRYINGFPYMTMIILNVIEIILGFIVMLNPIDASMTLAMYLGVILIAYAILNIIDMVIIKKNIKDKENKFKEIFHKFFPKVGE